tara:strand:+ start:4106 stop:4462 length:357 start_codon:yes stop_codon:yes gene_type:complete
MYKVVEYAPYFVIIFTILASHQLGADKYVLAVNAMALCLVFLLAKRCGETAGADKVSTKLSAITAENKGLKDNLMKVYSMLQEKQQQPPQMATMPPPPARQIPVEKQAADEVDVKPYA